MKRFAISPPMMHVRMVRCRVFTAITMNNPLTLKNTMQTTSKLLFACLFCFVLSFMSGCDLAKPQNKGENRQPETSVEELQQAEVRQVVPPSPPPQVEEPTPAKDSESVSAVGSGASRWRRNYGTTGIVNSFEYKTYDDKAMTVYYHLPSNMNNATRVMFVVPGKERGSGEGYAKMFRTVSIAANVVIIAPEFSDDNFNHNEYAFLNIKTNETVSGKLNPNNQWVFHYLDDIFKQFVARHKLGTRTYILWGQSAGGQFAHRTLMFSQSPYLEYAIAANSGTYTFFDENINYGPGIKDVMEYKNVLLHNLSNKKLFILIGSEDTEDMGTYYKHQGKTRYDRAFNFYENSKNYARQNNVDFNWELIVMRGAGHGGGPTVPYTLDILRRLQK